jgi:DNA-binding MarR family transcriptional regulator
LLPDGLHLSHFSVLNHLVRVHDGVTPLRIAKAFQVTKGTMTNTLSVLSKRGLINILPHKTDGRSKLVFITEAGRLYQENAIAALFPAIKELDSKIDWGRVVKLLPELARIRQVLDEDREG